LDRWLRRRLPFNVVISEFFLESMFRRRCSCVYPFTVVHRLSIVDLAFLHKAKAHFGVCGFRYACNNNVCSRFRLFFNLYFFGFLYGRGSGGPRWGH